MSVESEETKLDSELDLNEAEKSSLMNFFISLGAVGIVIALYTVLIYGGIMDYRFDPAEPYYWFYKLRAASEAPVIFHFPNDGLYAEVNMDILLPFYNPNILQLFGIVIVLSSVVIAFSLMALYVRFRHPLALVTAVFFIFTVMFTLGWLDILVKTPLYTDEFGHIGPVFSRYVFITQFIEDVAWAFTTYLIAFMLLGLTIYHVVTGPRQKQDIKFMMIGIYMMLCCMFGLLVPHLGFLWSTPDIRWLNASLVWLVQAQVLAIPGFWWISKVEKHEEISEFSAIQE
ncbi:MAG: hypothetical protein ACTSUB_07485 [Candidatus Thorarchaeota archaeon]